MNTVIRFSQPFIFAIAIGSMAIVSANPAKASTWGHLKGPFATESQHRERANFAAERRAEYYRNRVTWQR